MFILRQCWAWAWLGWADLGLFFKGAWAWARLGLARLGLDWA